MKYSAYRKVALWLGLLIGGVILFIYLNNIWTEKRIIDQSQELMKEINLKLDEIRQGKELDLSTLDNKIPEELKDNLLEYQKHIQDLYKAFETPVNFWGKVVDENGNPIPDVDVKISIRDRYEWEGLTHYHTQTDDNGLFSLTNKKGSDIHVMLDKKGYHKIPGKSTVSFYTSDYYRKHENIHPLPTINKPHIMQLQKKNPGQNVVEARIRAKNIPMDDREQRYFFFRKDQQSNDPSRPHLILKLWVGENPEKDPKRRVFPYRYTIQVANAKIYDAGDGRGFSQDHNYIAPEDGYVDSLNFSGDPTTDGTRFNKGYVSKIYIKFNDGTYGRARVSVWPDLTGSNLEVDAYINLIPGDRNTEYEPISNSF